MGLEMGPYTSSTEDLRIRRHSVWVYVLYYISQDLADGYIPWLEICCKNLEKCQLQYSSFFMEWLKTSLEGVDISWEDAISAGSRIGLLRSLRFRMVNWYILSHHPPNWIKIWTKLIWAFAVYNLRRMQVHIAGKNKVLTPNGNSTENELYVKIWIDSTRDKPGTDSDELCKINREIRDKASDMDRVMRPASNYKGRSYWNSLC